MTRAHRLADTAAAATPAERDRFADAVRAGSILAVVLGHWLITQFVWRHGTVELRSALGAAPSMWPLTWVLQVIPLFFFVGGYANRRSWQGTQHRGGDYAAFVDRRLHRLLAPTVVFLIAVTAWSLVEAWAGWDVLGAGGLVMLQPLWFLGVYVVVIALTPLTVSWHERWGWRVVFAALAVVAAIEFVRIGLGHGWVAYANVVVVWVLAHQFGYLYGDGSLTRGRAAAMAVAGFGAAAGLVAAGVYPARMIGVPGDTLVNMNPPTAAMTALAVGQIGLAVLLRGVVEPVLHRRRVWQGVVAVNLSIMSIYLWHQFALAVVSRIGLPLGLPQPAAGTASWWLARPMWFILAGAVLALTAVAVSRFEHRPPPPTPPARSRTSTVTATVAVLFLAPGLLALAGTDSTEMLAVHRLLRFLDVAPVIGLVLIGAAVWLLHALRAGDGPARRALFGAACCFLVTGVAYAVGVGPVPRAPRVLMLEAALASVAVVAAAVTTTGARHVPGGPGERALP